MAKMGQSLPATLPPGLVPPSMQRLRRSSETPAATQLPCNCTHNCPCLNDFLSLSVCLSVCYIVPLLGDQWYITKQSSICFSLSVSTPMSVQCVYMLVTTMCLHKWLNWSKCLLGCGIEWTQGTMCGMGPEFPPPQAEEEALYGNIHGCAVCPGFPVVKYSRCFRLPLFRKQTEPLHGGGQNNFPLITIMFCI